jgi:crotonobetainyl-CoA:carnitine CoA-transferase CaiB-like acyl-CoA transferase
MGANFMNINRNKRSVVLDLKRPQALEALLKLVDTADVLVHCMRKAAAQRLGIGYAALAARNPRLIYAAASGYRHDGPRGDRPAYDDIIQGESGIAALNRTASGEPRYFPMTFSDKFVGHMQASAIGMALFNRERTGVGQEVFVPMFETMLAFNLTEHLWGATFDPPVSAPGYPRMLAANHRPYQTQDGYICVHAVTDRHWRGVFEAIERPDMASDERFATVNQRSRNIAALYDILAEEILKQRSEDLRERLERADVPNAPMSELEDILQSPYGQETGFFKRMEHPSEGSVLNMSIPTQFSRSPVSVRNLAPRLGEHTQAVLGELGYSADEIAVMSGAVTK